jgi:hypothetical protein
MPPNFALLDVSWPEVARLIADMVQARDAIEHRSWSRAHGQWTRDAHGDPRGCGADIDRAARREQSYEPTREVAMAVEAGARRTHPLPRPRRGPRS